MPHRSFKANLKYRPLDPLRPEIRLLEVLPANSIDQPIRSRLINVPLTADTNYIGLSLLYGNSTETELIYVNGQPLHVPESIDLALRNVRTIYTPEIATQTRGDQFLASVSAWNPNQKHSSLPCTTRSDSSATHRAASSVSAPASADSAVAAPSSPPQGSASKSPSHSPGPSRGGEHGHHGWRATGRWLQNAFRGHGRNRRQKYGEPGNDGKPPPLRIWLDALCTNPADAEEMSHHRSHLALAYREARVVIGWLGVKDNDAMLAVKLLTELADSAPADLGNAKHRREHPEHCE